MTDYTVNKLRKALNKLCEKHPEFKNASIDGWDDCKIYVTHQSIPTKTRCMEVLELMEELFK